MSTEMSTNRLRQYIYRFGELTDFFLHMYVCNNTKNAFRNDNTANSHSRILV